MSYTIYAISIIIILILGLIIKEDTLSYSVKIILCIFVGLMTYLALNTSTTEGFARNRRKKKGKKELEELEGKIQNINNTVEQKIAELTTQINNIIPSGTIVMCNKEIAPVGWALCDGKEATNFDTKTSFTTPDLRGRFILGSGKSDNINLTERKISDKPDGNEQVGLVINNIPNHSHNMSIVRKSNYWQDNGVFKGTGSAVDLGGPTPSGDCTGCISNKVLTTDSTGKPVETNIGTKFSIMPPYYILTYIIKI
jgi:microcystin-dependent protein